MFTAVPRLSTRRASALATLLLTAVAPAQEVDTWLQRFPDDGMPELLLRSRVPKGRLAIFRSLAKLGERAHAPLMGMMRMYDGQLPEDLADAFGDFESRAAWCLPVLLEMLPRRDAQPIVLELLRRLGSAAASAAPALEELRLSPGLAASIRRQVEAALAAISQPHGDLPSTSDPAGGGPPLEELLTALEAGPRRWPALQAILLRGEDAALAGLEVLLRLRAADATHDEAIALLRTQQWTMRARLRQLKLDLDSQSEDLVIASLRQATLAGLPPRLAQDIVRLMGARDVKTTRLLILLAAQWADMPRARSIANSYLSSLRTRAPDDLVFLTRPALSAEERAEMIASFRAIVAGEGNVNTAEGMQLVARLRSQELDRITPELVPTLLRAFGFRHPLHSFAYRSLCNAGPECIPLVLEAVDDADSSTSLRLYEVIATIRPASADTVQILTDRAFDRNRSDWSSARSALQKVDRAMLVAELQRRLGDSTHPVDLRYYAKGLHEELLDEKLAALARGAIDVDPQGMDQGARYALFRQLSQRGRPGFDRMVELLRHADREVRTHALRIFGSSLFDAPGQVDVLLGLLDDEDPETVHYAAIGLGAVTVRHDEVVERLCALWEGAPESLRENIVRALGNLGRPAAAAAELVEPRLKTETVETRLAAAYALLRMQVGHSEAEQVVRSLLGDDDPEVRCRTMSWLRFDAALLPTFADAILPQIDHRETAVKLQVLFTLRVMDPGYSRRIADKIRALQLTQEPRLQLWVSVVRREKLGDKV